MGGTSIWKHGFERKRSQSARELPLTVAASRKRFLEGSDAPIPSDQQTAFNRSMTPIPIGKRSVTLVSSILRLPKRASQAINRIALPILVGRPLTALAILPILIMVIGKRTLPLDFGCLWRECRLRGLTDCELNDPAGASAMKIGPNCAGIGAGGLHGSKIPDG
jgi:hypothetical protein